MITSYGLNAALAMAALLLVTGLWCRSQKIGYGPFIRLCALGLPMAFLFSRIFFALTALGCEDVFSSPVQMLYFWDGGASITGAFAGLILAAWIVSRLCRVSCGTLLDGVALGAPAAIIIERLTEPSAGLGVGRYVDTEWLQFLGSSMDGRHPVYLYEAVVAGMILLALCLMLLRGRGVKHPGDLLLTFMTLYGCTQTLLESLRDDAHMVIYFIRINQIAALIMAAAAFVIWMVRWARKGAGRTGIILCSVVYIAAVAQGVVQEFAVDSNLNMLLEYGIMALCLAVLAALALIIRKKAE